MKKWWISLVFLALGPVLVLAQPGAGKSPEQGQKVKLLHADSAIILQSGDREVTRLVGGVRLYQDSVYMSCDSAILINKEQVFAYDSVQISQGDSLVAFADYLEYDGRTRKAYLEGQVVLVNGERQLFTERLDYDLNTKVASYFFGATLVNDSTQLGSRRGYYYVDEETAYFKDSVVVSDPKFYLKADTLRFNIETQTVYFLGPTLINADSSDIYCEDGFYDTQRGLATFSQNAQYQKDTRRASAERIRFNDSLRIYWLEGSAWVQDDQRYAQADTIRYLERTDESYLVGNASFRDETRNIEGANRIYYNGQSDTYRADGRPVISEAPQILEAGTVNFDEGSGLGIATDNVIWQDTSANLAIRCDSANYRQEVDYLKAMGGPRGRPELIAVLEGDSLFMASDTLFSRRTDTRGVDSARILSAYARVRLFKSDLQAVCDSMVYNTTDSLFKLFQEPILWSDTSQFSADTILMQMANDEIDKIFLIGKAMIINETDGLFYNQIKGKFITAHFREGELYRMDVSGNAETIYYAKDDEGAYIGVDKSVCSELVVHFGNNEVERLTFRKQPQSQLIPMQQADHDTLRLQGFRWLIDQKPYNRNAIFAVGARNDPPLR